MEAPDMDVMVGSHSSNSTDYPAPTATVDVLKLKRKRTKRPPPFPRAIASSSSTSSADAVSAATEEEEEMAHCLILLAQGRGLDSSSSPSRPPPLPSPEKFTSRKFAEAMTTAGGKAGFYVYECKTCNRCFPSFQALGGHRASHKKPKLSALTVAGTSMADENIQITDTDHGVEGVDVGITNAFSSKSNAAPAAAANSPTGSNNNKIARVHECSICGAEFSSGQALGGHMRRHRPIGSPPEPQELKKERNLLSLDLNLPAPSDENTVIAPSPVAAFSFASKRPLVFSATSALVDCHY